MRKTVLSRIAAGALVGFLSAPLLTVPACASTDTGKADPPPGLLDPAKTTPGLRAGDRAPAGELRDPKAEIVRLEDLYADGPTVMIFYRGGWCPFCVRDLQNWQSALPEFQAAGARVVAVSPESSEHALETARASDLAYDVYVDQTGDVVRAFRLGFELDQRTQDRYRGFGINLAERNAAQEWILPAPAVYVIDTDGVIRYASADWDYRERAGHAEALAAVRGLD